MRRRQASVLLRACVALVAFPAFGCSDDATGPVAPTPVTQGARDGSSSSSPTTSRGGLAAGSGSQLTPGALAGGPAPGMSIDGLDSGSIAALTGAVASGVPVSVQKIPSGQAADLGSSGAPLTGFDGDSAAFATSSSDPSDPRAPSGAQVDDGSGGAAGNNAVGLKAAAPRPLRPIDGVELADPTPALAVSNARGLFVEAAFQHEFAVLKVSGRDLTEVESGIGVAGADNSTSYQVRARLDLGESYVWRARALLDGAYGPWSDDASFSTAAIVLGTPRPSMPGDGATVGIDTSFTVRNPLVEGRVAGRAQIEIRVATNSGFTGNVLTGSTPMSDGARTTVRLRGALTPETTYYWQARATASTGGRAGTVEGAWSDHVSFETAAIRVTVPTPLEPADGATVSTEPVFTVRNARSPGIATERVMVQVRVASDGQFDNVVARGETFQRARGQTNIPLNRALERGQRYFWQVRAWVEVGGSRNESDWSAARRFTTTRETKPTNAPGRGECCPPRNRFDIVQAVIQRTGNLYRTNAHHFTDRVVECLAVIDGDWGRRRNDSGTISDDVAAYRTNSGPGFGPYSVDLIVGAGGPDPRPQWGGHGRVGGSWFAVNASNCVLGNISGR